MMQSFMQRYLSGNASIEEISGEIDVWHDAPVNEGPSLPEYLGLLPSEYQIFVENEWKFIRYMYHLKNVIEG